MTSSPCVEAVLLALRAELARSELVRESRASTASLESAIVRCEAAVEALRADGSSSAAYQFDVLARTAIDEWELGADLTVAVVECAQNLRR